VKFFTAGAASDTNSINNFVDGSFAGTIASLQYANSNYVTTPTNAHTTLIASGQILNVTGSGGLMTGTGADAGNTNFVYVLVKGAGTLSVNNTTANITVNQGLAANGNGSQRATLNLSGLDNFAANVNRIGVGTTTLPGGAQNVTGTLILAKTNLITTAYAELTNLTNTTVSVTTNAIEVGSDNGNAGGANFLFLGQSNAIFSESIAVGKLKTTSAMLFNPLFSNPTVLFRGQGGGANRIKFWIIGDMASSGSSSSQALGTNNFSGGSVDAMVDTMILARDRNGGNTGSSATVGTLTFTSGTFDINNLLVGDQAFNATGNSNPMIGIVNVNGPTAALVVNSNLILGNTTVNSTAAARTSGTLNIVNGSVFARTISVGANSTNNVITMTNGTLAVTNTLASPGKALTTLTLTNSTLQLNVTTATNIVVTNLVTGGVTNVIALASVAVMSAYPAQIPLIRYYSGPLGGVGYNFGFGSSVLPASAPNAFLSNNVASGSVDLVLPTDPRPVITNQPASYSGSPGDNVTFTVGATGVPALSFQWQRDGANLSDGGNVSGATTSAFSIIGAQPSDNGNYTVVVTNLFGSTTSTPPAVLTINAGNIAPSITGPNNQTVIQGNNATFTASVAGVPAPTIQWQKDGVDIPGATTASLTVTSAQHPADDGTYSITATNIAGAATNSATLTVIVPPAITVQPANTNAVSGSPASFSVTASGFPAPGYQWKKNGSPIANATTSSLVFASVQPSDAASYTVAITNAAGSISSSSANLIVNSTMTVFSLSPSNGATGICLDTLLRISFDSPAALGNAGRIRIFNVTNATTPVDTIDLSLNAGGGFQTRNIAATPYNTYPVIISNSIATIFPHAGVLTSNQTYYVTIENVVSGAFKDATGATFSGINDSTTWQFTTKSANPPANSTNIVVAADGSGDFCTVQGAVDFLPANSNPRVVVNIRNGYYQEIVFVNAKNNITFRGQEQTNTIISYPNNDPLNGGTSLRPMFRARGNDLTFDALTLTNSTPKGGSQAEALRIDGQRDIFTNVFLASFQDTLLINNSGDSAYFVNCLIQGDTDFIWGLGAPYFQNCEIRALNAGHNTQMRTDAAHYGATFADCLISKSNGATFTTHTLGRGIQSESDNGNASYLNCRMDNHILPAGWQAGGANQATLRYWEFQSVALDGVTPIDVSQRTAFSQQISASLALQLRNLTNVLAGWLPPAALSITSQPSNQMVNAFQPSAFAISASGIFTPTYQWRKDGSPISGATSATLSLPHAHLIDAGSYDCVVSNINAVLVSSNATLTVNAPTQPDLTALALAGGQLVFTVNGDTGPDYAVQASTNLVDWQTIFTTNSPGTPFDFADPNTSSYSARFYRIAVGPPLP
jgi:pectin methylesterase-like acyl-CoA thioesterase